MGGGWHGMHTVGRDGDVAGGAARPDGRARHGRGRRELLLSMVGPWRHRPRGGVVRTYACEHAAGRARVRQPTLARHKLRRV